MARQKGVLKFEGQMGGVSFYKTAQDGFLAREKGGVDADRIKNDPAFERTRENGAEFGRAGSAGKLLRTSLRALILNSSDSRMASRLTREMVKVIQADETNTRGQRNVIDGEAELLQGFEFNEDGKLTRTFFAPFNSVIDRVGGNLSINIPAFVPGNMIAAPQGATHVKLIAAGVEVDFENGIYVVNTAESAVIVLGPQNEAAIALANAVTPASTKPLFIAFGVEFYQEVNGVRYPLRNGAYNALALVKVDGGV
jgi:hypothetical protein